MRRGAGRWARRFAGALTGALRSAPLVCLWAWTAAPAVAQGSTERLFYRNPTDGTPLAATLDLPEGAGPFPAVIVLSLAGVDGLTERLERLGWAVLAPDRRGMGGAPERELRASFQDLADDVAAARAHLDSRPDIDGATVGLVAQGGETLVGMLVAAGAPEPAFLVLVSPRGMAGAATFRLQQRRSAERRGLDAPAVDALDRLVERLSGIVAGSDPPSLRAYRIRSLLDGAPTRPYQSSSFPTDLEGQVHAFSSRWWHDYLSFAPDTVLVRVRAPTLVLEGEEPLFPLERNLPPVRRSLDAAPTGDVTICVVPGRVEHALPPALLGALEEWLRARSPLDQEAAIIPRPGADPPERCLEAPEGR